ncbi:MAG: hypothetical protein P4L61_00095 [Candidatus Pacebacteria bacterium]|nr:hypothetical protein [Candidatus Paceibacterota bacterium]
MKLIDTIMVLLQKKAPIWVYTVWHMKNKLTPQQHKVGLDLIAQGSKRRPVSGPRRLYILIGQVGAGKSSVANHIAKSKEGTVVVNANDIRLRLQKAQGSYSGDRAVGEFVIYGLLCRGYSVVADSDHGDERKRKSLLAQTKDVPDLAVCFIRVHADFEIIARRAIEKTFSEGETIYSSPAGARSDLGFSAAPAALRLREFWRRTPHHYDWSETNGGEWKLKKPSVPLLADLDTGGDWQTELDKALAMLK